MSLANSRPGTGRAPRPRTFASGHSNGDWSYVLRFHRAGAEIDEHPSLSDERIKSACVSYRTTKPDTTFASAIAGAIAFLHADALGEVELLIRRGGTGPLSDGARTTLHLIITADGIEDLTAHPPRRRPPGEPRRRLCPDAPWPEIVSEAGRRAR